MGQLEERLESVRPFVLPWLAGTAEPAFLPVQTLGPPIGGLFYARDSGRHILSEINGNPKDPTFYAVLDSVMPREQYDETPAAGVSRVYFIRAIGTNTLKMGVSRKPEARIADLQTACPFELALVGTLVGSYLLERLLAQRFREHWIRGEWYRDVILPDVLDLIAADDHHWSRDAA